jgi:hypothetical protein
MKCIAIIMAILVSSFTILASNLVERQLGCDHLLSSCVVSQSVQGWPDTANERITVHEIDVTYYTVRSETVTEVVGSDAKQPLTFVMPTVIYETRTISTILTGPKIIMPTPSVQIQTTPLNPDLKARASSPYPPLARRQTLIGQVYLCTLFNYAGCDNINVYAGTGSGCVTKPGVASFEMPTGYYCVMWDRPGCVGDLYITGVDLPRLDSVGWLGKAQSFSYVGK